MSKKVFLIVLCAIMSLSVCSCAKEPVNVKPFDAKFEKRYMGSFVAAENSDWQLKWDSEHYRVTLANKLTDTQWSTLPTELLTPRYDEDGFEINNNPKIENPLIVEFLNESTRQIELLYGYTGSLKKGNYSIDKIKNGLKITYCFEKQQISIPVCYTLLDDGINVSVDPSEIAEGDIKIYQISLSPFFCCASNKSNEDYLFVPSGSGALIYPDKWDSDIGYTCSYPVYGEDLQLVTDNNSEDIRLPVFGSKNGDKAVCAIIDSGMESASVVCDVGNNKLSYSAVYAKFNIRGISVKKNYSDNIISQKLSVSYYPLTDENADYVGIANKYRNYLKESKGLSEHLSKAQISLKFIGGTYVDSQFLGVPYDKFKVTTDIDDVKEIVSDIYESANTIPYINLVGFGTNGLNVGKIAGGYKISSAFKTSELNNLLKFCKDINSKIYMDFDIAYFSKSGNGIYTLVNAATSTSGQKALRNKTAFVVEEVEQSKEYLVERAKLISVAQKAVNSANKYGVGASFSTVSAAAYSDYSKKDCFCKGNFAKDYNKILQYSKGKNVGLLANNANDYAVVNADIATDVPTQSAKNDLFMYDIPFYGIVFKGYIPLFGDSINLAAQAQLQILRSAESGMGLSYTLIKNYDNQLLTSDQTFYYACVYDNLSQKINSEISEYKDYFEAVKDSKIQFHEIISKYLRKTAFDNGTVVYVNYGNDDIETECGVVAAKSFVFARGK